MTAADVRTAQLAHRLRDAAAARGEGDVVLIETHISWLLLAGRWAYKIKKPLTLDFLDFGTLAKRRAACEEELRLNRRSAPELYVDVQPIVGSPEAPQWGQSGTPIEWAVRMRRFPAHALMANMAARGELRARHIDALACEIAAFQARAAVASASSSWGAPAALAQRVEDNFPPIAAQLCAQISQKAGPNTQQIAHALQALQTWSRAEGARLAPFMTARRAAGHVREGHGDLHLGNLVWLHERPLLFDAIEFNPAFRWLDDVADIAFLFMDLHAHDGSALRHAPLAWRFVNAWLERTGDFAGLARLAHDVVYRALVRAKVAALRAAQAAAHADEHDAALCDSLRYLHLAQRLAAPRKPWLALTRGVSGSGKSSQSQTLIEQRGMVRVRADVERKRLFGLPLEAASVHVPGGIYGKAASVRTFERLLAAARVTLQAGLPVLVDATFIQAARRAPFIALADALGVPWRILAFEAPLPVLRQRVRQRHAQGFDASEADEAVLLDQLAHVDALTPREEACTLHIDTTAAVNWTAWQHALPQA